MSMNDATFALLRYRECCRSLWNIYLLELCESDGWDFSDRWDLVDDFRAITKTLFDRLVVSRLGAKVCRSLPELTLPYIDIVPARAGIAIMINRPSNDGCNYWDDPIRNIAQAGVL